MIPLIDRYMPRFDVREQHRMRVRAPQDEVYASLERVDFVRSPVIAALLLIRVLPALVSHVAAGKQPRAPAVGRGITLASFEGYGFRILERRAPEELVIGLEGQFWRPGGALRTPTAEEFLGSPPRSGAARAVWNFRVIRLDSGASELTTETRVLCASPAVRRRFLPYWWLIRPGSGAIRRAMLRRVRDDAQMRSSLARSEALTCHTPPRSTSSRA